MSTMPTVAILGTGTMGAGMARNIAGAGLPVRVWNRTSARATPLAEDGCEVCDDLAGAVADVDVVVTMLFDVASVEQVAQRMRQDVAPGTVWLQMSTVGVEGADRLASLAEEMGLVYVDAPVLGTRKPAEEGTLVVLASGPEEVRAKVRPVLDAVGQRTLWVGEAGKASRLKLVANAWVLTVVEGIAEALTLAQGLDLDPRLFLEAVKGGAMDAPYVQLKGTAMLGGDFTKSFGLDGAAKDAGLIVEAARGAGLELAVLEAVRDDLARALAAGHGGEDVAATFLEHVVGNEHPSD